ncbi:MAG: GNAT family N-acetyltransferase [Actinocatenispora sp.]
MWLRAGVPADSQDLFTLQRSAALAAYGHIFPQDRYPFPEQQVAALCWRMLTSTTERVLVAVGDNGPVGYVSHERDLITNLYVAPDQWHRGIGGRLLAAAVDAITDAGHGTCRLKVMTENHRARELYQRRGWQPDGTSEQVRFPPHPTLLGYRLTVTRPTAGTAAAAPTSGSTGAPADASGTAPARTDPPHD